MKRIEQWRLAALKHVDLDAAARLLEDTKTSVFSQLVKAQGDIPVNRAETEVRASEAWKRHVCAFVEARTAANRARVEAEYARMLVIEATQDRADERQQFRMEVAS
jgi:hypothetical protein